MRLQISTSCSRVSNGTLPICRRYIRTGSSRVSNRCRLVLVVRVGRPGPVHVGGVNDFNLQRAQLAEHLIQVRRRGEVDRGRASLRSSWVRWPCSLARRRRSLTFSVRSRPAPGCGSSQAAAGRRRAGLGCDDASGRLACGGRPRTAARARGCGRADGPWGPLLCLSVVLLRLRLPHIFPLRAKALCLPMTGTLLRQASGLLNPKGLEQCS